MTPLVDKLKARWPQSDLEYITKFVTAVLLLLVLPLAVAHFFLHPLEVADHAIKSRVSG